MSVCRCFECGNDSGKWEEEMIRLKAHRMIMQQKKSMKKWKIYLKERSKENETWEKCEKE